MRIIIDPGIPPNAVPSLFRRLNSFRRVLSVEFILSFILPSINWYKLVDYSQDHFWCVDSLENRDGIFSRSLWTWLWAVMRGARFRAGDAPFSQSQCFGCPFSHETPLKSSLKCSLVKTTDFKEMLLDFAPSFPTVEGICCCRPRVMLEWVTRMAHG